MITIRRCRVSAGVDSAMRGAETAARRVPVVAVEIAVRIAARRLTWVAGVMYSIPSLALFALLVPFTGLSITTAEIGLVSYTLLILIRNIVGGIRSVPPDVREAAVGMGYSQWQLLWQIELPLGLAVIVAGVRVAVVTTIGLVTVTGVIGQGGLGALILQGIQQFFATPLVIGAVLSIALAVILDGVLVAIQRRATPWTRKAL